MGWETLYIRGPYKRERDLLHLEYFGEHRHLGPLRGLLPPCRPRHAPPALRLHDDLVALDADLLQPRVVRSHAVLQQLHQRHYRHLRRRN